MALCSFFRPVASLNLWGVTAKSLANTYHSINIAPSEQKYFMILAVGNRFGPLLPPDPRRWPAHKVARARCIRK